MNTPVIQMRIYKQLAFCLLLLSLPASADEAEVWKCKIKETMGIKNSDGELRPTRFNDQDHEYRILNLEALIEEVGGEQVGLWQILERPPFDMPADYFYRSTSRPPNEMNSWDALRHAVYSQYHGDYAFFDIEEGRFETRPKLEWGWFTAYYADYAYEFAECVRFYD